MTVINRPDDREPKESTMCDGKIGEVTEFAPQRLGARDVVLAILCQNPGVVRAAVRCHDLWILSGWLRGPSERVLTQARYDLEEQRFITRRGDSWYLTESGQQPAEKAFAALTARSNSSAL